MESRLGSLETDEALPPRRAESTAKEGGQTHQTAGPLALCPLGQTEWQHSNCTESGPLGIHPQLGADTAQVSGHGKRGPVGSGSVNSSRLRGAVNRTAPGKIDVYVAEQDLGKWIALMTEPDVALSVDDLAAEKAGREHVHLHSTLALEAVDEPVVVDGIRYVAPEALVIQGLRTQDSLSLTDTFALLVAGRDRISWKRLLELAERQGVLRGLRCTLDLINAEARKDFFRADDVSGVLRRVDLSSLRAFPRIVERGPLSREEEHYREVGKRWIMGIYVPRAFVSKIARDLVR